MVRNYKKNNPLQHFCLKVCTSPIPTKKTKNIITQPPPLYMYIYVFFTLKYYVSYCFVAKYVDTQLKSGNKEWSDEQLDRQLDRVMVLFRYIHGMRMHEFLWIAD